MVGVYEGERVLDDGRTGRLYHRQRRANGDPQEKYYNSQKPRRSCSKNSKNELETTAYRWSFYYFAGLQETQLILQTRAETNRDGAFASSDIFPHSYLLSQKYNPEWKFD